MAAWLALLLGVLPWGPAVQAQLAMPLTVAGELLWVAGSKMVVSVRGRSVTVDLSAVPLDQYLGAQPGTAVLVRGVWTEGGVLVASSLETLSGSASPAEREGF